MSLDLFRSGSNKKTTYFKNFIDFFFPQVPDAHFKKIPETSETSQIKVELIGRFGLVLRLNLTLDISNICPGDCANNFTKCKFD